MKCEHPSTPCGGFCACCCPRCIDSLTMKGITAMEAKKTLRSFLLEKIEEQGINTPVETLLSLAITAGYTDCTKQHVYAARNAAKTGATPSEIKRKPRQSKAAIEASAQAPDPANPFGAARGTTLSPASSTVADIRAAMRVLGVVKVSITVDNVSIECGDE